MPKVCGLITLNYPEELEQREREVGTTEVPYNLEKVDMGLA